MTFTETRLTDIKRVSHWEFSCKTETADGTQLCLFDKVYRDLENIQTAYMVVTIISDTIHLKSIDYNNNEEPPSTVWLCRTESNSRVSDAAKVVKFQKQTNQ